MKTLKDLYAVVLELIAWVELWGAEEGTLEKIEQLTADAREAIMEEQGITDQDVASKLPTTTQLGEKSGAILDQLAAYLPKDM